MNELFAAFLSNTFVNTNTWLVDYPTSSISPLVLKSLEIQVHVINENVLNAFVSEYMDLSQLLSII